MAAGWVAVGASAGRGLSDGEIVRGFDFRVVEVLDREFTKTLGIVDDDGNTIWRCRVDGVEALWKRGGSWHRNQRGQLVELKPAFGLPKIGCSLVQDHAGQWGVLMRFHGDGRNLTDVPARHWQQDARVVEQLLRTALFDLAIGNNNRLKRNYLWLGAEAGVLPIDEEKALDFEGLVTFRMDQATRAAMWAGLRRFPLSRVVAGLRSTLSVEMVEQVASRVFHAEHARLLATELVARLGDLEAELYRYLGSRYADGKRAGIPSKRARGPQPWDGY